MSAMGLVLAVCALGVAIIVVVAVNEWRLWRRSRLPRLEYVITADTTNLDAALRKAEQRVRRAERKAEEPVVFEWDWPAA